MDYRGLAALDAVVEQGSFERAAAALSISQPAVSHRLRALEEALLEFAGSAMVISHDRWFLDRICTHILACEGNSQWFFYDGNFHEYEADKKKRLGEEGARPKRMRFKPIKPEPAPGRPKPVRAPSGGSACTQVRGG
eukprot:gene18864-23105_t